MRASHIDEIPPGPASDPDDPVQWKPLRHHFGVRAFGVNAFCSPVAGGVLVEDHTEDEEGHEELYFVARGRAAFTVEGREIEAPAGTFVFLEDPRARRVAVAREPDTLVVAVGARVGAAYQVSPWELRLFPEDG
jgi:quercetin dioxygenase-like cupin family protein